MADPRRPTILDELKRRRVFRVAAAYLVAAFVVLQAADLVIEPLALPGWTMRLLIVLAGAGFPVALALSWAFDVTPEGLVRTGEGTGDEEWAEGRTEDDAAPTAPPGRWGVWAGSAVGAVIVGLGFAYFGPALTRTPEGVRPAGLGAAASPDFMALPGVAVVPLEDFGGAGERDPFGYALASDIVTLLQGVDGLRVAAFGVARRYADEGLTAGEIAAALDVDAVLTGDFRRTEGRMLVNLSLVDPASGAQLWAERFDRELTARGIFDVQEEVARAVVRELEATLAPTQERRLAASPPTDDLEAYGHYGRGVEALYRIDRAPEAVRHFRRAVEADSTFAMAWAALSVAEAWSAYLGGDRPGPAEVALARRAVELDPELAEAHTALGLVQTLRGSTEAGLRSLDRAIELAPNNTVALVNRGMTLNQLNRFDEAVRDLRKAYALDPWAANVRLFLGSAHWGLGELEAALAWNQAASEARPEDPVLLVNRAAGLILLGRTDEAFALADSAVVVSETPLVRTFVPLVHALGGRRDSAVALALALPPESLEAAQEGADVLALLVGTERDAEARGLLRKLIAEAESRLESGSLDPWDTWNLAAAQAALGRREAALASLERATELGFAAVVATRMSPVLGRLRDDPRYLELEAVWESRAARQRESLARQGLLGGPPSDD